MIIVCSWCGRYLGQKEPLGNTAISHSICLKCKNEIMEDSDNMEFKTHISITVPKSLCDRIREEAEQEDRTVSNFISRVMGVYFAGKGINPDALPVGKPSGRK